MQFAHTGNNGLAGLFVSAHTERGVFLSQAVQSNTHLFLVSLGLRLNSLRNHRFRELHAFQNNRRTHFTKRVTRSDFFQTNSRSDITGFSFLDFLTFVCVHLQQTTDTFLLVLDGVQHRFTRNKLPGVDTQEGQLTHIRVRHNLERQSGARSVIIGFACHFIAVHIHTLNRRNINRRR